jgi:hypothetical protein
VSLRVMAVDYVGEGRSSELGEGRELGREMCDGSWATGLGEWKP